MVVRSDGLGAHFVYTRRAFVDGDQQHQRPMSPDFDLSLADATSFVSRMPRRILIHSALVVSVATAACGLYWSSLRAGQAAETQVAQQRTQARSAQLDEAVALELDATLRSVDMALRHLRTAYLEYRDLNRVVVYGAGAYPREMIDSIFVFGADGKLVYSSAPDDGVTDASQSEYFRVHAAGALDPDLHIAGHRGAEVAERSHPSDARPAHGQRLRRRHRRGLAPGLPRRQPGTLAPSIQPTCWPSSAWMAASLHAAAIFRRP